MKKEYSLSDYERIIHSNKLYKKLLSEGKDEEASELAFDIMKQMLEGKHC